MFKHSIFKLTLIAFSLIAFTACSSDDDFPEDNREEITNPDIKPNPASFKFLTINHSSIYGEDATLSYISNEGNTTTDKYFEANNALLGYDFSDVTSVEDKLFMTVCRMNRAYYTDCFIEILDSETFVSLDTIDLSYNTLGYELSVNTCAPISNDRLVAAGTLFYSAGGDGDNLAVISLKDKSVIKTLRLDFPIRKVICSNNKIFIAGSVSNGRGSKIAVFDQDNISLEGMRIISDNTNLFFNGSSTILQDSKGMIWAATYDNDMIPSIISIDPKTEQIAHTVKLPYSVSSLSSVGLAIDQKAENIYLRSNRAFYHIDALTCAEPDDVTFEITTGVVDGGMQCTDLKMSYEGTLLFIKSVQTHGEVSQVYELDPKTWEVLNIYQAGINSRYIYIAE